MTESQTEELRVDLEALKESLEGALNTNRGSADVVDLDQPIGRVSRIDAIQQQKMARANRGRARVRLEMVRAALAGIRSRDYGECKNCDEDIGYDRLKARPESALCLGCQREFESRRKRRIS